MSKKELYYRFQNTLNIEKESRYVDIELAHEDFYEYKDRFSSREELFYYVLDSYYNSFSLRKNISPEDLLALIEKASNEDIADLVYKYKLPYIFGYKKREVDEEYSIEDILDENRRPDYWNCDYDTYLVIYEGIEALDVLFAGVAFTPVRIVGYYDKLKKEYFEVNKKEVF